MKILVGLHPSSLAATPDGRYVTVANANSDTVSVIDVAGAKVVETISTRPHRDLPFGSAPNAHVFSADGRRLYVSNGTNNAIAVIEFAPPASRLLGLIPTGWYPAGLAIDPDRNALYVANVKGVGSRDVGWKGNRVVKGTSVFGFNSHDYLGSVSLIPIPSAEALKRDTEDVFVNNRQTQMISVSLRHGAGQAASGPRAARRAVGLQARAVHHQREPHVRSGVWRHRSCGR